MASFRFVLASIFVFLVCKILKKIWMRLGRLSGVAGPPREHWYTGNYHRILRDGRAYSLKVAEEYGTAVKIHALLGDEQLFLSDPLALYYVLVKEQDVYTVTDMYSMGNMLIFGEGLISTTGAQHRKQRKMLNPVFSMANMRDLLPLIQPIADKLCGIIRAKIPQSGFQEVDILPLMSRAALEYVCQATLGYSFNALESSEDNEYIEAVRTLSPTGGKIILLRPYVPFVARYFSSYWRNKLVDWLPIQGLKDMRRIVRTMDKTGRRLLAEKKAALQRPPGTNEKPVKGDLGAHLKGRDIMSIVLKENVSASEKESMTEEELLGQINTFIFAGFETTSTAISRILHILATRPDVQSRLRTEIRAAKRKYAESLDGEIGPWQSVNLPYDLLMSLPYLDAIIRETLRVHPPSTMLSRTSRKPTILPLQFPVKSPSGEEVKAIPLREGTTIMVSTLASNHNKAVWGEDASEWRPERWLNSSGQPFKPGNLDQSLGDGVSKVAEDIPGNKNGVKYPGVYGAMMTFFGGGRSCIGFKFMEMEMKQVLTTFLSTLHFSLPSSVDENGNKKEIYWKINAIQVPVILPPAGDYQTAQVPLDVRLVVEQDFTE